MNIGISILNKKKFGNINIIDPNTLPNRVFDIDADNATESGGIVTSAIDSSGNARHFAPNVFPNGPTVTTSLNGHQVFNFDGVDDVLVLPAQVLQAGTYTIYCVVKINDTAITNYILDQDNSGSSTTRIAQYLRASGTLASIPFDTSGTPIFPGDVAITQGVWNHACLTVSPAGATLRVNGVAGTTAAIPTGNNIGIATQVAIGNRSNLFTTYAKMAVAHVLYYDALHTDEEIEGVSNFLKQKYSL